MPTPWQFEMEIFPAGWRFPAQPAWVAGWIFGPDLTGACDVRGWIDDRPFLALHGLPRPEISQRLAAATPPYPGFSLLLTAPPGARLFRLEARNRHGAWSEFFRTDITAESGGNGRAPLPRPDVSDCLARLLPALLQLQTQRSREDLADLADEVTVAHLAEPLNALPVPPFFGALETPKTNGWIRYGHLSITGWLAHRTARITRLTAMVDSQHELPLRHGLPRRDVDGLFPDLPGRDHSLFMGQVDLAIGVGSPVLLRVFAELDNGEKHLVFGKRFVPRIIAGADVAPLPLSRLAFGRALWALYRCTRRHGLKLGPAHAWRTAVNAAWAEYRAEAPAPRNRRSRLRDVPEQIADNRPLRILLVTHNLNFEGAPWFIFELGRYLHAQPGISVRVLSPQEGPLRATFAEAGMPVDVVNVANVLRAANRAAFIEALDDATAGFPWDDIDLVIGNTMVTFWAVHAARRAGKPAALYVHESAPIRRFFETWENPALYRLVEDAFRLAQGIVFTADSSRLVFDYLNARGHFALLPSWVNVSRIDAFVQAHDKAALRRKHRLDPDAVIAVNIGTVCERKGQHTFVTALERLLPELRQQHADRRFQFVMLGARPGPYLDLLQEEVRQRALSEVVFVEETGEILDFYRLADIFVCTSFEESFPRVLMESAAFRLPIVSTNVNGIAEMLGPEDAWLMPPGDDQKLAGALREAIAAHLTGDDSKATRARSTILHKYHEDRSLPQHLALIRAIAAK